MEGGSRFSGVSMCRDRKKLDAWRPIGAPITGRMSCGGRVGSNESWHVGGACVGSYGGPWPGQTVYCKEKKS